MEILMYGTIIVLIVITGILLLERKVLLEALECTEDELKESEEDFRCEKNKYQRKLYAYNVLKNKVEDIHQFHLFNETKDKTANRLYELIK